jgi:CheY-like chemotaxis protein
LWTPVRERLHFAELHDSALRKEEATPMSDPNPKHHIFVVNNSQDVLALFSTLLTGEGFRVTTQPYVDKDLDKIVELAPDLIVLDYMWAEEDEGWSLLQMLKMDPRTISIPAIVCTGAIREVEQLRPHLQEMNVDVIYKPFDIDVLLTAIRARLPDSNTDG